jgi:hypothetical protein
MRLSVKGLTQFENAVMEKLLCGDDPALITLRQQAQQAQVASRDLTGVGFFISFILPPGVAVIDMEPNFRIGDVHATVGGLQHGAGFVLFINKGRLDILEGYSYDEPWPDYVDRFALRYEDEPRQLKIYRPNSGSS